MLVCLPDRPQEIEDAPTLDAQSQRKSFIVKPAAAFGDTARPRLERTELAERVFGLAPGRRLVVVDIGCDGIAQAITADDDHARGAFLLVTDGLRTGAAVLDRLLDDLADIALSRWPHWHGRDDGGLADTDRSFDPIVSGPWLRAARRRAGAGHPPRFREAAREIQLVQLLHAIDPSGVVLIGEINPASAARAAPVIEALEWCMGHGAAIVMALPAWPPDSPPYDRILYGACEIVREPPPVAERFLPPRSKAHPASVIEQRVETALQQDAELRGLFCCNEPVPVGGWGQPPRVDLLCRAHRIVVELDGPEHRSAAKYADDRHRDYTLLTAGYLVLRITNEQVEADLRRAIEKIRSVVRLRSLPIDAT